MVKRLDLFEQKIFSSPAAVKDFQGDWQAYLKQCARYHDNEEMINARYGSAIAYQRQCALAYLGKHAQYYGGVCSKEPRIFTPILISKLEILNKAKRFMRYPWLERLLNLLSEIEHIQGQRDTGNIISLVPHRTS